MPTVSQFSTSENFAQANAAKAQLQEAINEAEIAVRAGIPGAEQALSNAKDALGRVNTFLNVYFPSGQPQ